MCAACLLALYCGAQRCVSSIHMHLPTCLMLGTDNSHTKSSLSLALISSTIWTVEEQGEKEIEEEDDEQDCKCFGQTSGLITLLQGSQTSPDVKHLVLYIVCTSAGVCCSSYPGPS